MFNSKNPYYHFRDDIKNIVNDAAIFNNWQSNIDIDNYIINSASNDVLKKLDKFRKDHNKIKKIPEALRSHFRQYSCTIFNLLSKVNSNDPLLSNKHGSVDEVISSVCERKFDVQMSIFKELKENFLLN